MKETFYFPHDYNATQDPKMMQILSQCGLSGIAIYWIIIEILHQQPESTISRESYRGYIEMYGRKDGENEHLLNKIEQMLITVGLFVEQDEFVYSNRVLENKKQRQILSEKRSLAGKKSAEIRQKATSVEQVLNKGQQGKERKGKEIVVTNYIGIRDYWNSLKTLPGHITDFKNIGARDRLLPECRKITPDIEVSFGKLIKSGYTEEDFKLAVKNYVGNIINRDPNNDFSNHRFSLYEFFSQKNGFIKFLN